MGASNYLFGAALAGAAAHGMKSASDAYQPMTQWVEWIKARDRHAIINGLPLEDVPAPPRTGVAPVVKSKTWLLVAALTWLGGALLVSVIAAVSQAVIPADDYSATGSTPPLFAFVFTFFLSSFFFAPLGLIVGLVVRSVKFRSDALERVRYEASVNWYQLWERREHARLLLGQGRVPVDYVEFLGLDPQQFVR